MTKGDAAWLITKTIMMLGLAVGTLLTSVVTSVWAGAEAMMSTGNGFLGLAVGLTVYLSAMAGRRWIIESAFPFLFSAQDLKDFEELDKMIRGEK